MPHTPFTVVVSDLLGHTGARRTERLSGPLEIDLDQVATAGPAEAEINLEAIADGLVARGAAEVPVVLRCNRCLTEVDHLAQASITQAYGGLASSDSSDDDIMGIEADGSIDLEPVLHDELSLSIPLVPLCSSTCAGLCPTCGTDLNKDPCAGHPEESSSPFAALQGLFEVEDSTPE